MSKVTKDTKKDALQPKSPITTNLQMLSEGDFLHIPNSTIYKTIYIKEPKVKGYW